MNRSLERSGSTPLRVLVVGSPEWRRAAAAGLEGEDDDHDRDHEITITASVASRADLDARALDASDCLLTDDRTALSTAAEGGGDDAGGDGDAGATECPIVYVTDPADDPDADSLLAAGAADVLPESTVESPSLLAHRLRRVVGSRRPPIRSDTDRSDGWYRRVMEHSSDLQLVFDESGAVTFVSPAADEIADADAMVDLDAFVHDVHDDDRATLREAFDAVRTDGPGSTSTVEYRYRRGGTDDTWRVHEATLTNRRDDVGGVVASIRDMTAYHYVERELDESFRRVTDGFYALDTEWQFTYVNDRAVDLIGLERSDILGRHVFEVFPEMEGTPFQSESIEAMERQEPRTIERYYEPYDSWVEARLYPSPTGLSVYFRDVTDRVERERQLKARTERLRAVVENVPVILYALDADGTITLAEGRGFEHLESLSVDLVDRSVFDAFDDHPEICADAETLLDGTPTHSTVEFEDRVFEVWGRPILENGTVDRAIGIAVDVTERVRYQEALNAIHEATRQLLTADSTTAACEYIVDIAADALDLETVVYRFDDRENELVPEACSAGLESLVGSPPRIRPTDDVAWRTFVDETAVAFDDLAAADPVHDDVRETAARSGLYVPLGEHGVLVALSPEPGRYDDDTVELTRLFSATAETALDRLDRAQRLRERERQLERQNERLERLNAANQVRQDIEQQLLRADSRAEIEQALCDRIVDLEACSMAWIGDPDPNGDRLQPRAVAGRDRGYLDAVTVPTVDDSAAEPAGRAARTGDPVYVENVAAAVHDGPWRADALSKNFQSVYAIPLVYDEFHYGVLALYGDDRDAFDDPLRATVAELGDSIASTINAINRKNALLGDGITELELELESGSVLSRLAERLDRRIELAGATKRAESTVVFLSLEEPLDDASIDRLLDIDGVASASIVSESTPNSIVHVELTAPYLGAVVDAYGGSVRELVADPGAETTATVTVPDAVEIREVLSEIDRHGFSASMLARRDQPADDARAIEGPGHTALLESLTDRQREVVQTAYYGGFFDWPRETTGEAIAASLDISPPAFHKHIRSAERKVFSRLFDDRTATG